MITPDDPTLAIWRTQRQFRHLTDAFLNDAIAAAAARVDKIATRSMTPGAHDLAVSYVVRLLVRPCDEERTLREIVEMLTGGKLP